MWKFELEWLAVEKCSASLNWRRVKNVIRFSLNCYLAALNLLTLQPPKAEFNGCIKLVWNLIKTIVAKDMIT